MQWLAEPLLMEFVSHLVAPASHTSSSYYDASDVSMTLGFVDILFEKNEKSHYENHFFGMSIWHVRGICKFIGQKMNTCPSVGNESVTSHIVGICKIFGCWKWEFLKKEMPLECHRICLWYLQNLWSKGLKSPLHQHWSKSDVHVTISITGQEHWFLWYNSDNGITIHAIVLNFPLLHWCFICLASNNAS